MKNLVLVALAVGGLAITGCTTDEGGYIDVTWNLIDADGAASTCGAAVTAEVTARGGASGTDFIDLFNCTDGGGTTALLPIDGYLVTVDFLDSNNQLVASTNYAFDESLALHGPASINIDLDGETVLTGVNSVMDGGFLGAAWSITDGATASDCTTEQAGGVSVDVTLAGTTDASSDIFNCEDGVGIAGPMFFGDYVVSYALLDTGTPPLAITVDTLAGMTTIASGNEIVPLTAGVLDVSQ